MTDFPPLFVVLFMDGLKKHHQKQISGLGGADLFDYFA